MGDFVNFVGSRTRRNYGGPFTQATLDTPGQLDQLVFDWTRANVDYDGSIVGQAESDEENGSDDSLSLVGSDWLRARSEEVDTEGKSRDSSEHRESEQSDSEENGELTGGPKRPRDSSSSDASEPPFKKFQRVGPVENGPDSGDTDDSDAAAQPPGAKPSIQPGSRRPARQATQKQGFLPPQAVPAPQAAPPPQAGPAPLLPLPVQPPAGPAAAQINTNTKPDHMKWGYGKRLITHYLCESNLETAGRKQDQELIFNTIFQADITQMGYPPGARYPWRLCKKQQGESTRKERRPQEWIKITSNSESPADLVQRAALKAQLLSTAQNHGIALTINAP